MGKFARHFLSSAAEVSPLMGFKKAAIITRKQKILAVVMKLVATRRKEKKVLLSSATASRVAVKKPAVVLTVDSDSEEEGEPMEGQEAGYEEREENPWIVVKKMATRNERRTHGRPRKVCNHCLDRARVCPFMAPWPQGNSSAYIRS
jgi:hypothetical protein